MLTSWFWSSHGGKRHRIANSTLKEKKRVRRLIQPDLKTYSKVRINKTVWLYVNYISIKWKEKRHCGTGKTTLKADQWNRIEKPEVERSWKLYVHTKPCTQIFRAALFILTKIWKQPRYPSVGDWINNLWSSQ